jgi:hypothetical protein
MRFAVFSSLVFLAILGCSASSTSNDFEGAGGQGGNTGGTFASSGAGNNGAGGTTFTTGAGNGGPGCSQEATYVYVLSDANVLYSFDPPAKQFKMIGPLTCPTTMLPNSMAVDRDAFAWVDYVGNDGFSDNAGGLYKVSTKDAKCQAAAPINLPSGWFRIGMGFSSDTVGGTAETLFIAGVADPLLGQSTGLGRVDFTAMGVVPIGQFSGSLNGQSAELTGTGDGRLFGFFTTTPVQVAEINKANGAILNAQALPAVETPQAWAFSFWGGDFYLYTAPSQLLDPTRTTNVTRYRPSDQSVDTAYMLNIGFRIVGAGVSTCAPIQPPQ